MLSLGERSCLAAGVDCYCVDRIEIGDDVTVSQDAFLCTASHDIDRADRPLVTAPIRIGRGAWIFARATILPGVSVGEGAVVAACAVVTRDVPAYAVVAGNPARVVRQRTYRGPAGDGEAHDG
jgi:putative colanic acid biosynthesis acetyltransferase WcaF